MPLCNMNWVNWSCCVQQLILNIFALGRSSREKESGTEFEVIEEISLVVNLNTIITQLILD